MDISPWDGTLSPRDFHHSACVFAEKWEVINAGNSTWSWISRAKSPWIAWNEVDGYLSLEKLCFVRPRDNGITTKEEPRCAYEDETNDNAVLVQSCDDEVHCFDFHILYSSSYRVPVLYFRAYRSDGQSLLLCEAESFLPENSAKLILESKWTFVTSEDHPYLKRPWYRLHPCGTSQWMKLLLAGDGSSSASRDASIADRYITSWLSVVGPVVGLKIPLQLLKISGG